MFSAAQCGHVITITDMKNALSSIFIDDQQISAALNANDSFRLQRLSDLYRGSYDKEAFVAAMAAKLLMEHDRRLLGNTAAHTPPSSR